MALNSIVASTTFPDMLSLDAAIIYLILPFTLSISMNQSNHISNPPLETFTTCKTEELKDISQPALNMGCEGETMTESVNESFK